jgi:hypothetical protein
LEIQPAATRAIQAILDEAYALASQTLIGHLETLRRLAAYLVEHERVDGDTFDKLFDGRLEVPTAGDEWRAAASRPRAWGEVVDLAGHRNRRADPPIPLAAAIATAVGDATVAVSTRAVARRARNTAAGWLHRAERWIRSTELDADRS